MSIPILHCTSSPVSACSSSTARSICFDRESMALHRSLVSSAASPPTNAPATYASPTVSILKSSQRLSSSSNFEKSLSISAISCIGVIAWLSTVKPTRSSWSTTAIFDSHGRHPGAEAISLAMWRGRRSHSISSVRRRSFWNNRSCIHLCRAAISSPRRCRRTIAARQRITGKKIQWFDALCGPRWATAAINSSASRTIMTSATCFFMDIDPSMFTMRVVGIPKRYSHSSIKPESKSLFCVHAATMKTAASTWRKVDALSTLWIEIMPAHPTKSSGPTTTDSMIASETRRMYGTTRAS
mmetsp:Transcript_45059/g.106169  ORF Transcript_45059/g.106169 Transcript_45059/m.106169 type:complete len:298 (+) Transcript_45059:792-1685(+)